MPDPTAVWEAPELVARLTVGTRVRVRRNPECEVRCSACGRGLHEMSSFQADIGYVGQVMSEPELGCFAHSIVRPECVGVMPVRGHRFFVCWHQREEDHPDRAAQCGNWFAAVELSPVEE